MTTTTSTPAPAGPAPGPSPTLPGLAIEDPDEAVPIFARLHECVRAERWREATKWQKQLSQLGYEVMLRHKYLNRARSAQPM